MRRCLRRSPRAPPATRQLGDVRQVAPPPRTHRSFLLRGAGHTSRHGGPLATRAGARAASAPSHEDPGGSRPAALPRGAGVPATATRHGGAERKPAERLQSASGRPSCLRQGERVRACVPRSCCTWSSVLSTSNGVPNILASALIAPSLLITSAASGLICKNGPIEDTSCITLWPSVAF